MIKTTYTPGPWKLDNVWALVMSGKEEICAIHSPNKANARLITAAPELLETLKRFAKWERDPDRYAGDLAGMIIEARRVIFKATGE
jgi:hypothetical protein